MKANVLICKQCGGKLNLPDEDGVLICPFCGCNNVIKDEIIHNNYNTTQHITNVYGADADKGLEELLDKGEKLLALEKIAKANKVFEEATEKNPESAQAWVGYIKTGGDGDNLVNTYKKALKFVTDESGRHIIISLFKENYGKKPPFKGMIFWSVFAVLAILIGIIALLTF